LGRKERMVDHFQKHWKWVIVTGLLLVPSMFVFFTQTGTVHEVSRWITLANLALFAGMVIHILEAGLRINNRCSLESN